MRILYTGIGLYIINSIMAVTTMSIIASCFLWPVAAYLVGSIPFGLVFAEIKGVDLRRHGSGNIGATNVTRVIGKGLGLLTMLADMAKGFLPVMLFRFFSHGAPDLNILALTGIGAVLGHCYPIFLRFHGGKGVATSTGVFLAVCPSAIGVALAVFLFTVKITGFVSAGSLTAAVIAPAAMHFFCPGSRLEFMAWGIAALVWWRHKDNIRRLLSGEEHSWRR
ncbi:MAG: glycerol-3-phosphate 1-O-acyltransferase PlsY [Dissulfurimicrobium sp.]|uniref:glycerol-3-phosphate 1-O-acyltransferase PlsY n=1 Tax=Dissulfurimicrobium sp. TaxID=2022436 RepID=UPI00404B999C